MIDVLYDNKVESKMARENERYEEVNQLTGTYLFEYDVENDSYYVCANYENMFELTDDMKVGPWSMLESLKTDDESREELYAFVQKVKMQTDKRQISLKLKTVNGEWKWFSIVVQTLLGLNNSLARVLVVIQDIDEEMRVKKELAYRTSYDSITQLYNAESFYKRTAERLEVDEEARYAVISVGIDHFTVIADRFGIEASNKCLKFLSACIINHLKWEDVACRYDADVFVVLKKYDNDDELVDFAKQLSNEFAIEEAKRCGSTLAFGIYKVVNNDLPVQLMCDRSLLARREARGNKILNYAFYNDKIRLMRRYHSEMESEMEGALVNKEFLMYLQPKIDLKTGKIHGAEALVRWQHKPDEIRMPGDFLPLFESNGFIKKLDEYMWDTAAQFISEIKEEGMLVPISVNISRYHVDNSDLVKTLTEITKRHGIDNKYLELEITETLFTQDVTKLYKVMQSLQENGFVLEMDDFGSGYSSLNMLREAPVGVVKIDRYFIDEILLTKKGQIVIENTVNMLKQLGMLVVAEGVEKREQVDFLKSVKCDVVQGYYFSKPVPAEDFRKMLREEKQNA